MPVYECGDQVVYGVHGVCKLLPMEDRMVDRKKVTYYVLESVDQPGSMFYVPAHNEAAVAKMRRLMSKEELEALLRSDISQDMWIEDEPKRKQFYRELINSGDRAGLIGMVRSLHVQKQKQLEQGKKFHLCDESFLKDAMKLLDSEFAQILQIPRNEVPGYVMRMMLG